MNDAGRGRVESDLPMKDQDLFCVPDRRLGCRAGDNRIEHLAGLDDYGMAVAAYWTAVESRPKDKITLRQGIRLAVKNWPEARSQESAARRILRSAPTAGRDTGGRDLPSAPD